MCVGCPGSLPGGTLCAVVVAVVAVLSLLADGMHGLVGCIFPLQSTLYAKESCPQMRTVDIVGSLLRLFPASDGYLSILTPLIKSEAMEMVVVPIGRVVYGYSVITVHIYMYTEDTRGV